jgi:class 3 adenylate cyclase
VRTQDDLFGTTVNKAARIASAAAGGETSISTTTRDLVGTMEGVAFGPQTPVALKGLTGTHQVVAVTPAEA